MKENNLFRDVVVVADDFTGANDAGVSLALSGKKVSVANNAQLERDYAVARGNDSKPVLLTVDGHFTLEPNPDSGEMVKTLVADKDAKFVAGKDCNSK